MKTKRQFIRFPEFYKYPKGLEWLKNYIKYVPARIRQGQGKYEIVSIPMFEKPVSFCSIKTKKEYAVLPIAPRYVVDKFGNVYDLVGKQLLKPTTDGNYNFVYIIINGNEIYRTNVHRLVAYAWMPDNDFVVNYIVDHKNNNKKDNSVENLQWTSMMQNSANVHARKNLKLGMYIVLEPIAKKIAYCQNLNCVSRILGKDKATISEKKTPAWFSIRSEGFEPDRLFYLTYDTSYKYAMENLDKVSIPFGIIVKNLETNELEFYENKTKLWNKLGGKGLLYNDKKLLKLLKESEKYKLVNIHKKHERKSIKIKHIKTGEVREFGGIKPLKKFLGVSDKKLKELLSSEKCYSVNDWVLCKGNECCEDPMPYKRSKGITVTFENGREKKFDSLREAAKVLGIDKKNFIKYLNGEKVKILETLGIKDIKID